MKYAVLMRPFLLLAIMSVSACATDPVAINRCPPPPWPGSDVIETIQKVGKEDASFAGWFKDVMSFIVECDALNGGQ